jgi:hypothetical protein
MNSKQQSHFKMFVATLGVLDLFQTTRQEIADFLAARNALAGALEDIRTGQRQQAGVTTGVTADKRQARWELCQAAALVGGAVAAWADKQDNHELFDAVDYRAADLLHQSEQTCLIHAQAILEAGTASLAALTPGGTLTQADLTDLQSKLEAFKTLLTQPRQTQAVTKGATDVLPAKLDAADRILERRIDRLMERYRVGQPEFYQAYKVARVIVDAGGGNNSNPPTPPMPEPPAQ